MNDNRCLISKELSLVKKELHMYGGIIIIFRFVHAYLLKVGWTNQDHHSIQSKPIISHLDYLRDF